MSQSFLSRARFQLVRPPSRVRLHGTEGSHDVSHLTYSIFPGLRATSVERERRTSCHAKVRDEMLVPRFDASASEHKSDVGMLNAVSRHSSITYVLQKSNALNIFY